MDSRAAEEAELFALKAAVSPGRKHKRLFWKHSLLPFREAGFFCDTSK